MQCVRVREEETENTLRGKKDEMYDAAALRIPLVYYDCLGHWRLVQLPSRYPASSKTAGPDQSPSDVRVKNSLAQMIES